MSIGYFASPKSPFIARFERLAARCAAYGIELHNISGDGFVLIATRGKCNFAFTADNPIINESAAMKLSANKLGTYQLLGGPPLVPAGFAIFGTHPMPPTRPRLSDRSIKEQLELFRREYRICDKHLFVKPNTGSNGLMARKCTTDRSLVSHVKHVLASDACVIVQEVLTGPEYRVVILDGHPILAYQSGHLPPESCHCSRRPNVSISPTIFPKFGDIPAQVVATALFAAKACGLRLSGIDCALSHEDGKAIVIEVNGNPGFGDFLGDLPVSVQTARDSIDGAIVHRLYMILNEL